MSIQMRAITKFQDSLLTRVGNWSIPETVLVIIVSPPQNISIIGDTDFFAVTVGEMIQLTVRIDLEWSAVNTSVDDASTSRRKRQAESNSVTGHEVALGTEPIETYGIAAQDTLVRRFGVRIIIQFKLSALHHRYIQLCVKLYAKCLFRTEECVYVCG